MIRQDAFRFFAVKGLLGAGVLFLFLATRSVAQLGMATLSGTVTDPSGAVIPGAHVILHSATETASRETSANSSGEYVIPAILPGTYQLEVSASGFQRRMLTGIVLTSGQGSTLNVTLSLSKAIQQVTVNEAPPLLQTTTAAVGGEVTARQFTSLPLLGRNFTTLVDILPGAANVPSSDAVYAPSGVGGDAVLPAVYGQRQRDSDYTLDGAPDVSPNFTFLGMIPPPEAIAEMKVETGMDTGAYGWASGANINVVTKSGTNQYRGDAWEYLRNGGLDARSYFIPNVGAFQWNQFGGAFGGPLVIPHVLSKSKAWYVFGYYEGIRIHQAANVEGLVPTAAQLSGDFSGSPQLYNPYTTIMGSSGNIVSRQPFVNNQIPTSLLNSTALTLAKALYPAPNLAAGVIPGVNYLNSATAINTSDQWSARVDHQFGSKNAFYARYSDWRNPLTAPYFPSLPGLTNYRFTNATASDTYIIDPTFLVTGRFALQRAVFDQSTGGPDIAQQTGLVSAFGPFHGQDFLPPISIFGYAGLGQFFGLEGPEYYLTWTGDAKKIRGRHTLAFGAGFIRTSFYTDHTSCPGICFSSAQTSFGANTGDGLASYLLGLPFAAFRNPGDKGLNFIFHNYSGYFQDTFRATHKLTLNLGLRWDYIAPPIATPGLGTFDWNTGKYYWDHFNPILGLPANITQGLAPPDYNGWQPRFGVAYALTPKTAVRGSFGIFDEIYGANQQSPTGDFGNWPYAEPQTVSNLNVTLPTAFIPDPFPGPPVASRTPLGCDQCVNNQPSSSRLGYVEEWSTSVQRQLTPSSMVQASYFGSHGVKLDAQILDNTATPGVGPFQERQRWPQFPAYILNNFDEFMSWYDGLSLEFKKNYSKNLSLLVSYTWSKTMDQSDSLGTAGIFGQPDVNPTRFQLGAYRGPAGYDMTNIFSASYVYDLPWKTGNQWADGALANWELSGIISADSGVPYSIYLSTDNENIGSVGRIGEFPNLLCNPNAAFSRSASEWFNTACYQLPAFGTVGDAGRHGLYADPLANWDFALMKRWPLGRESRNLEFRAEFFNLLNGSTFAPPSVLLGTPGFGTVSATRQAGRQIQFALKLHF